MQIPLHNIIPSCHGNNKTEELCKDMWSGESSEKNSPLVRRRRWQWIPLLRVGRTKSPGIVDQQEREDKKEKLNIDTQMNWELNRIGYLQKNKKKEKAFVKSQERSDNRIRGKTAKGRD